MTTAPTRISPALVALLAVATGLAVASLYYAQPLLPFMERDLGLSSAVAGLVVTVTQLGYAAGLALLVPLGDLVSRRRLLVGLGGGCAVALGWMASAPSAGVLLPAAVCVGVLSVQAQILVPFAATLAGDEQRGSVIGTVMSGLLVGILLARTAAGWIAEIGGSWRWVYAVAALAMLVQAATLASRLPAVAPSSGLRYPALLRSVLRLMRDQPVLRRRALMGALAFAGFSVLWTAIAFLLDGAPYHYGTGTIGLFGLVGAAGALTAGLVGRLADRGRVGQTTAAMSVLLAVSWVPLGLGHGSLAWLLVGIVVLDVAAQGLHISNQSVIYDLAPDARSRVNAAYMTSYFLGGAAGSAAASLAWDAGGWGGVTAAGAAFGVAGVLAWLVSRR